MAGFDLKTGTVFRSLRAWHVDWRSGDRIQLSPLLRDEPVETSVRVAERVFANAELITSPTTQEQE